MIDHNELDLRLLDNSFSSKPHNYYVMYDEVSDEFMVKLIKPENSTSVYHIGENNAFLVDLENYQVVGIILFDFEHEHLSKLTSLSRLWKKERLSECFKEYRTIRYEPERREKIITGNLMPNTDLIIQKTLAN